VYFHLQVHRANIHWNRFYIARKESPVRRLFLFRTFRPRRLQLRYWQLEVLRMSLLADSKHSALAGYLVL
jgi:hypothetical protein